MNLQALKTEIDTDPLARGYAGMTDEQIAKSLAVQDRQPFRDGLTGGMIASSIVLTELTGLTAGQQNYVRALFSAADIPLTDQLKTELSALFPAGSTTRANLVALLKRQGTRAEELNLGGQPTPSDVAEAKRLP